MSRRKQSHPKPLLKREYALCVDVAFPAICVCCSARLSQRVILVLPSRFAPAVRVSGRHGSQNAKLHRGT